MAIWLWLTPPIEMMQNLAPGWVLYILARNLVLALIVFGGWHLWLYRWRRQEAQQCPTQIPVGPRHSVQFIVKHNGRSGGASP
jgi:hypothetical protein